MTGTTSGQVSLPTATDSDDTEHFLTVDLVTAEQTLVNLFHNTTGHNHDASGEGAPIATAGIGDAQITPAKLAIGTAGQRIRTNVGATAAEWYTSPAARVFNNANIGITASTPTVLALNSERYDTDVIHDNATNNSRLTCKTAGKYRITGQVQWASGAGTFRQADLLLNGTTVIAVDNRPPVSGTVTYQQVTTTYDLAVNDYVELRVLQDTAGSLNVNSAGNYSPEMMMEMV